MSTIGTRIRTIGTKTVGTRVMYIAAIIAVLCAVFWVVALTLGYVADDWGTPAVNEKSVPPPTAY
jgi:hypothetical protein